MSEFKEILLNKTKLKREFAKLTPLEGNEIRKNLDALRDDIPKVSDELMAMLEKEGLNLGQFTKTKSVKASKSKKPTKLLVLENQSFYVDGDKIKHKPVRGVAKKGATVVAYTDLNDAQKIEAKAIIDNKNTSK
ncbi:MAG: hypothetical protein ACPGR2_13735 [Psychrobium sp.]